MYNYRYSYSHLLASCAAPSKSNDSDGGIYDIECVHQQPPNFPPIQCNNNNNMYIHFYTLIHMYVLLYATMCRRVPLLQVMYCNFIICMRLVSSFLIHMHIHA